MENVEGAITGELPRFHSKKEMEPFLEELRKFRHRETLRIALCEMKKEPLESVHATFSHLADAVLEAVLKRIFPHSEVCAIGLGKLGGEELNYSSDVDLLFLTREPIESLHPKIQSLIRSLTQIGNEGFLYRVDMRLRPHGKGGSLILSDKDTLHYYKTEADLWELQVLLKARACCGNLRLGRSFLSRVLPWVFNRKWRKEEFARLRAIKERFEEKTRQRGEERRDVKMGRGGIRDIEFTIQSIQLGHGGKHPELKERNTLAALEKARGIRLLSERSFAILREGYIFLRRIENRLQLADNHQTFLVPSGRPAIRVLAKSLEFYDTAQSASEERFERALETTMGSCREIFEKAFFRGEAV